MDVSTPESAMPNQDGYSAKSVASITLTGAQLGVESVDTYIVVVHLVGCRAPQQTSTGHAADDLAGNVDNGADKGNVAREEEGRGDNRVDVAAANAAKVGNKHCDGQPMAKGNGKKTRSVAKQCCSHHRAASVRIKG